VATSLKIKLTKAGASKGTPGDAKCVTEILGGMGTKNKEVGDRVKIWSVDSQENN